MVKPVPRTSGGETDQPPLRDAPEAGCGTIGQVYQEHAPSMVDAASHILDDTDQAWDVVHTVFSRLIRSATSLAVVSRSYLIRAARNEALTFRRNANRRQQRLQRFLAEMEQESPSDEPVVDTVGSSRLLRLISKLPEKQQEILSMRLSGLKNNQIAVRLHVSLKTIEFHCAKAYQKLRCEFHGSAWHRTGGGGGMTTSAQH